MGRSACVPTSPTLLNSGERPEGFTNQRQLPEEPVNPTPLRPMLPVCESAHDLLTLGCLRFEGHRKLYRYAQDL